jgi:two-component system, cell cycle sensor histidine kinase and response regulator CckA
MVVGSYADLILQREANHKIKSYAEHIHEASMRASTVTRQLLAFSRQQILQPEVVDLSTVLADLGKILPRLLGEDIEVHTKIAPLPHYVKVDRGQLEQVIMNLAANARDAMPRGGHLNVEIEIVQIDCTFAAQHPPMNPGAFVHLSMTDTGIGMNAETKSRIFEPFFTTKERGKGTGLGLATVYGIVKQSGGFVWVDSEVDRGSRFDIYLPEVRSSETKMSKPSLAEQCSGGLETILLVEDEDALRAATGEFMQSLGYTVLTASDGAEAMRICEAHSGSIDLILTDLVMPGITGTELVEMVHSNHPEIRVIYMSGYTDRRIDLDPEVILLQKPFQLSVLAAKLREVLRPCESGNN